ncbi:hypothetical protein EHQ53_08565 [Leptospira langatensis]|uniref:Porin n=1 Tax=Leptospira langatensis TaxID=2484983 RepID=A0A5F1ZUU1_9LEPT|nr:hypothetical protein [Leptospira langatensis]TGK01318.1 hypothetical protein EHO57_10305 [Leptospira langatensis]TGL42230.1 hypothetical protein EHQ53_08565 [Leptospira langatensis]
MRKKLAFLVFLFLLPYVIFSEPQTIYLRNGKTIKGEILDQTATYIELELPNKEVQRIQKTTILRIAYKDGTTVPVEKKPEPIPEKPPEPEVVPPPVIVPPPVAKVYKRVTRNPLERHFLDLYAGGGAGTNDSHAVNFYYKYQNIFSTVTNGTPFVLSKGPHQTPNGASSAGLIYKFKKFSVEAGGLSTHSSSTSQNIGPEAQLILVTGTYPQDLKMGTFKTSYSLLARKNFELYPSIGYTRIWNKTTDDQSTVVQPSNVTGYSVFHSSEQLKGGSFGLGFAYLLGSKWEARLELERMQLKGSQSLHQQYTVATFSLPTQIILLPSDYTFSWKATGNHVSLKLSYFWRMGLGFWLRYDNYQWNYAFQDGTFPSVIKTGDPAPSIMQAVQLHLQNNAMAGSVGSVSKATSLQIGISKALNFGPEEDF